MKTLFLYLFFLTHSAFAKEDWLCTQEASQIQNGSLLACGIGEGNDENTARTRAFENAKAEFFRVCKASDTCNRREVSVEPKRTSCEAMKGNFKCYRLIVFTLGSEKEKQTAPATETRDIPDSFQPFVYESISSLPKLSKGMSKKDLLAAFGAPQSISDLFSGTSKRRLQMFYRGKMCVYERCYVVVEGDKVESWNDFKPVYTDDLK